jgi:hypothetical protein
LEQYEGIDDYLSFLNRLTRNFLNRKTGKIILPRKIPVEIQEQVRQRADFLCEYCHTNERWQYVRFTIDHIVPAGVFGELDTSLLQKFTGHTRYCGK